MVLPVVLVDLLAQPTEGIVGAEDGQVAHVGQQLSVGDVKLQSNIE